MVRILPFPGSCPDSTIFRYSHRFYPFWILVQTVFLYSNGFYLFPVLTPILPIFGIHTVSTFFRNSPGQFFNSGTDSTFSRYSPGIYNFPLLTQILPFSDTRPDTFFVLARILPFPGTPTDSNIFWYSH